MGPFPLFGLCLARPHVLRPGHQTLTLTQDQFAMGDRTRRQKPPANDPGIPWTHKTLHHNKVVIALVTCFFAYLVFLCHSFPGPPSPLIFSFSSSWTTSPFWEILTTSPACPKAISHHLRHSGTQLSQSLPLLTWILTASPSKPSSPQLPVGNIRHNHLP